MSKYLEFFKNIDSSKSRLYGGKSSSLGEMLQAGIPVPDGFALSTEVQKEFQNKPFSEKIKSELRSAFKELNLKRVAIRSSAVAEDSADASWAGQLESYLNVEFEDIEENIIKCWASIKSDHAVNYAKDKGLKEDSLLVGVAIQSMIPSDVAGVMFTVDPVTKSNNLMVIEGLYGLGEMLVQGVVTPDRYLVDSNNMKVVEFNIEIKSKFMRFSNGQNITEKVPKNIEDRSVLREKQVVELAKLGKKIETHYGTPQDIEWALVNSGFYIIQSRPITTLN